MAPCPEVIDLMATDHGIDSSHLELAHYTGNRAAAGAVLRLLVLVRGVATSDSLGTLDHALCP